MTLHERVDGHDEKDEGAGVHSLAGIPTGRAPHAVWRQLVDPKDSKGHWGCSHHTVAIAGWYIRRSNGKAC